jgi:hypothetical protein
MAFLQAARPPDFPLDRLTPPLLLAIFGLIAAIILVCIAVASLSHQSLAEMCRENGPIENVQVGLYGLSALLFGFAGVSSRQPLHRLTFIGLALFVACIMLRELDFTHSEMPLLAAVVNGPVAMIIAGVAWVAFAVSAWRKAPGLVATGVLWIRGRGGLPLLGAAVLLLIGSLFDHHYLPVGRTADMIGEEALELVAGALVLLSAVSAVRVARTPAAA